MNKAAAILFTRLPIAGQTKTRLIPYLSGEQCASLHKALLCDIMPVLRQLAKDIFVFYTPANQAEEAQALQDLLGPAQYYQQQGEDLGIRMHQALSAVLQLGYESCVLLGADIPLLTVEDFQQVDELLASHDVVLCPTDDGGYWLVGLKQPFDSLFIGQEYSVDSVLEQAIAVCRQHRRGLVLGPRKLDIDTPEDLQRLYQQFGTNKLQNSYMGKMLYGLGIFNEE